MPEDDKDIFNRAEADLRKMQSELQLTTDDLLTVFLLIIANDAAVSLPAALSGLTTNYAAFLLGNGSFNDEKLAISSYLGRVGTDLKTFQYVLCTKIAQARAIASVQAAIPAPLPAAPYIPPPPKKPNPPPVTGLGITLSASSTTGTVGGTVTLTATVVVPSGRSVTKVEFSEGATLLGQDISAPYTFSYSLASQGAKTLTARAYDDSPTPIVSTSNAVTITVAAPAVPTPVVSVSAPKAGVINEAIPLSVAASVTGDTLASVQLQADGVNLGAADTAAPYTGSLTRATKGIVAVRAIALASQGGSATSAVVNVQIFDSKILGGGAGAGGASLAGAGTDFILFDANLAGGNATSMNINVGGQLAGVFNYDDTSYNGRDFAFYHTATNQLYTGKVGAVVEF